MHFLQYGKTTPIYALTGHEEIGMLENMNLFKTYLELENYEIKSLDLLTGDGKVPEDCACLIVASHKKDFAVVEANSIKEYIKKGGNILWLTNSYSAEGETPNIKSVLDEYGVTIRQDGVVLEQDASKMVMESPDLIIPEVNPTEASQNISNVLFFDSGRLEFLEQEKLTELGVNKTDIVLSSENSFFRTNLNLGLMKCSEANGEKLESSVLGALLEKEIKEDNNNENEEDNISEEAITSKLIVFANNLFIQDYPIQLGSGAMSAIGFYNNKDLGLTATGYLAEVEDAITIRKGVESTQYTATETQNRIIKIIIFSVPVVIIILGIVIWQLRRRKK